VASKFFLKTFLTILVTPIITGIILHLRFHIHCISIYKLLNFSFYSASFCTTFLFLHVWHQGTIREFFNNKGLQVQQVFQVLFA
jgi:hypothetical protein